MNGAARVSLSPRDGLTIREAAARTGMTAHALRYYERIGLLQRVSRAHNGHRRYGDDDLRWLELLRRLHSTGMPIRRMLEYARLARRGDRTIAARRALLDAHRQDVEARIAHLAATLGALKAKIAHDDAARARRPAAGPRARS